MEKDASLSNKQSLVAYLAAQGRTNSEIADALSMASSTVNTILQDERTQFEVKQLRHRLIGGRDVKQRFQSMLPKAVDAHEEILDNPNNKPALRFAAVQEVYDRALGKPKQTIEHEGSILRALYEKLDSKEGPSPIIDVTPSARPAATSLENPNGKSKPDMSQNPNFQSDPIDDWIDKNL